jgi:hypothetical protein
MAAIPVSVIDRIIDTDIGIGGDSFIGVNIRPQDLAGRRRILAGGFFIGFPLSLPYILTSSTKPMNSERLNAIQNVLSQIHLPL